MGKREAVHHVVWQKTAVGMFGQMVCVLACRGRGIETVQTLCYISFYMSLIGFIEIPLNFCTYPEWKIEMEMFQAVRILYLKLFFFADSWD